MDTEQGKVCDKCGIQIEYGKRCDECAIRIVSQGDG